jgi:hypothetical protein
LDSKKGKRLRQAGRDIRQRLRWSARRRSGVQRRLRWSWNPDGVPDGKKEGGCDGRSEILSGKLRWSIRRDRGVLTELR